MKKINSIILGFIILLTFMCINVQASPIDGFIEKGYITVEIDAKYYINEFIWRMANYKDKENIIVGCSLHHKEETGAQRATIYSMSTGKKLAKYNTWGIKIY